MPARRRSATPVITCGDVAVKAAKADSKAWLKGATAERGRAEPMQKGSDVTVWIKLSGLTPGVHGLHMHAGTCARPRRRRRRLGDVTAGPDGNGHAKLTATLERRRRRHGLRARRAAPAPTRRRARSSPAATRSDPWQHGHAPQVTLAARRR